MESRLEILAEAKHHKCAMECFLQVWNMRTAKGLLMRKPRAEGSTAGNKQRAGRKASSGAKSFTHAPPDAGFACSQCSGPKQAVSQRSSHSHAGRLAIGTSRSTLLHHHRGSRKPLLCPIFRQCMRPTFRPTCCRSEEGQAPWQCNRGPQANRGSCKEVELRRPCHWPPAWQTQKRPLHSTTATSRSVMNLREDTMTRNTSALLPIPNSYFTVGYERPLQPQTECCAKAPHSFPAMMQMLA